MSNVTALKPTAREMLAGIKIIDVDTHVSEWPELWTERAPAAYKNRMPRIVGKGAERKWIIDEDTFIYNSGAAAAVMKDGSKDRQDNRDKQRQLCRRRESKRHGVPP